jgi:hypothetical protein
MRGISVNASGSKLIQPAPLIGAEQIKKLGSDPRLNRYLLGIIGDAA